MPGIRCAIYGCNNSRLASKVSGQDLIFHVFPKPKDLVSNTMRREWISRCKRQDRFNPDTSRICSAHFVESDYERDLQSELLGR
jgi:THAP domain